MDNDYLLYLRNF